MTIGLTFGAVIEQVRGECGISSNTSRGIDFLDNIKTKIRRVYITQAEEFDWQHLEIKRDSSVSRVLLAAGSRYYNFPTDLNREKIEGAWLKWGSVWHPLTYNISYKDRTAYDPDNNQRSDPVLSWMYYGNDQFEVWPLPNSNGVVDGTNEIAFEGQKNLNVLVDTNDTLDLDGYMVAMLVAAEILTGWKKIEAAGVLADAALNRRLNARGNMSTQTRYVMGQGMVGSRSDYPRHPQYIPYTK